MRVGVGACDDQTTPDPTTGLCGDGTQPYATPAPSAASAQTTVSAACTDAGAVPDPCNAGACITGASAPVVVPYAPLEGQYLVTEPATTYRARVLISGAVALASTAQIIAKLQSMGFANVGVWAVGDAGVPADWPAAENVDTSGTFSKTRLAQVTWCGAEQQQNTALSSSVSVLSKWVYSAPPAAPAPEASNAPIAGIAQSTATASSGSGTSAVLPLAAVAVGAGLVYLLFRGPR